MVPLAAVAEPVALLRARLGEFFAVVGVVVDAAAAADGAIGYP